MEKDLTKGPILKTLLLFALPMMLGNLLSRFIILQIQLSSVVCSVPAPWLPLAALTH